MDRLLNDQSPAQSFNRRKSNQAAYFSLRIFHLEALRLSQQYIPDDIRIIRLCSFENQFFVRMSDNTPFVVDKKRLSRFTEMDTIDNIPNPPLIPL